MPDENLLGDNVLRGWKEIEAALGLTRQSILACGYPVRHERHTDGRRGNVFAFRDELARFMARKPKVKGARK